MTALVEFPIAQQRYELTPLVNKTGEAIKDTAHDVTKTVTKKAKAVKKAVTEAK